MSSRDPFRAGQDATEELRRAVESIREDVRAVVRDEVARAGLSPGELERMVAELVRRYGAEREAPAGRWRTPVLLAVGLALGLVVGAGGYRLLAGPAGGGGATSTSGVVAGGGGGGSGETGAPSSPPATTAPERSAESPATPSEVAARYDSLFESRAAALEPLLADLEGVAAEPVQAAVTDWRAGAPLDPGPRRRLHDALVQAAVNRLAGTDLALDGLLTRDPCGGASCGAVLQLWESRGDELGLPAYPPDASAREGALPTVERVLVMRGLEASGG